MKRKKTRGTRRGCCRSYSPDFSTEGWYIFHDIIIYNLFTAISSPILGNPFHKDFSIYTSFLLLSLICTATLFLGSSLFRTPCLSTRHQQRSHAVIPTEAPCDYSDGKWIYDQTVRSPPRYDRIYLSTSLASYLDSAHHLDLRAASNEDPTWLLEQREKEIKLIAGWIEAYNNRKGFGKI